MPKLICFCGSFKFHHDMEETAEFLRRHGFTTIVPQPSHIRHGHKPEEFKEGKYDKATITRWEREGAFSHLESISKSDVVYIFNKASYVGPAVLVEIGYAWALNKTIIAKSPINDITVSNYIQAVVPPDGLVEYFKGIDQD